MGKFIQFICEAGGMSAGKIEIHSATVDALRKFAESNGYDLDKLISNFDNNFKIAKDKTKIGKIQRKDMPVIDNSQVTQFQNRLSNGYIDIKKPFADDTDSKNPFPDGLSGAEAKSFLKNGLKDNNKEDDIIGTKLVKIPVKNLKPIQKQIYADKALNSVLKRIKNAKNYFENTLYVASGDNYIIDGHHRFLSTLFYDPTLKVKVLKVNLPLKQLMPLSTSYGDALGNVRNA